MLKGCPMHTHAYAIRCLAPFWLSCLQVINAKGLKGSLMDRMDAFVLLEVRKGRPLKVSREHN